MKSRFLFFILCFVFLVVPFVSADCTENCDTFDPSNPEAFNYETGDYSSIDWNQVDWGKIPASRIKEIPATGLQYSSLNVDQRLEMSSEQIGAHFNDIENLLDVNEEAALDAIDNAYGIDEIQFGNGARILDDTFQATYGNEGHITLTSEVYQSGPIVVNKAGDVVFRPIYQEGPLALVDDDHFILDSTYNLNVNGVDFQGKARWNEGVVSIEARESARIAGVDISNWAYDERSEKSKGELFVYFDGRKPEGNSISFDFNNGILQGNTQPRQLGNYLTFYEGNPFVDVSSGDRFGFELSQDSSFTLTKGDSLPSLVVSPHTDTASFAFSLRNGRTELSYQDNDLGFYTYDDDEQNPQRSVPLEFTVQDADAQNLLTLRDEPLKIVFDDRSQLIFVEEDLVISRETCPGCFDSRTRSQIVTDYVHEQFDFYVPIVGVESNPSFLQKTYMDLDKLPPEMIDNLWDLRLVDDVQEACGENTAGCASSSMITLGKNYQYEVLHHEGAHTRTFELDNEIMNTEYSRESYEDNLRFEHAEEAYKGDRLTRPIVTFQSTDGSVSKPCRDCSVEIVWPGVELAAEERATLIEHYVVEQESKDNSFDSQWTAIAGDVYGVDLGPKTVGGRSSSTWEDGTYGPQHGCVEAYGCNNFYEDVATHSECSLEEACWRPLVTPGGEAYDVIYVRKYQLLCQTQGFVHSQTCHEMQSIPRPTLPLS
jgi:hypothetical protein